MSAKSMVIDYLKEHNGATRAEIAGLIALDQLAVKRAILSLKKDGFLIIKRFGRKICRYYLIDEEIVLNDKYGDRRSPSETNRLMLDLVVMVKQMPGKPTAFYADLSSNSVPITRKILRKAEKSGRIVSRRLQSKTLANQLLIWWAKGDEPAYSPAPLVHRTIDERPEKSSRVDLNVTKDDKEWMRNAKRPRHKRIIEKILANNEPTVIPSYEQFVRERQ